MLEPTPEWTLWRPEQATVNRFGSGAGLRRVLGLVGGLQLRPNLIFAQFATTLRGTRFGGDLVTSRGSTRFPRETFSFESGLTLDT
jgi:hypothetical protein